MRYKSLNEDAKKEWHEWFAWHPVRINDHEKVWLCKVKRRGFKWYDYVNYRYRWTFDYELA